MKPLYLISRPPNDPLMKPVIDLIFSAVAFGLAPVLVLMGPGKALLSADQTTMGIETLADFGDYQLYHLQEDNDPEWHDPRAASLSVAELQALIQHAPSVQSF